MANLFLISPWAFQSNWRSQLVGPQPSDNISVFRLAEYHTAFESILIHAIQRHTHVIAPILREIPTEEVEHVRTTHLTNAQGERVVVPPFAASLAWTTDVRDVVDFDMMAFAKAVEQMAEQNADRAVDHLLTSVTLAAESVGNVEQARGAPFGWPVILRALHKIPLEFDADGNPILPLLVDDRNKRQVLPYPTASATERVDFEALVETKRREFNARSHRR